MPESVAKNDAGKPDILPDMGPHIDRLKPGRLRHEVKRTDADPAEHRIDESRSGIHKLRHQAHQHNQR